MHDLHTHSNQSDGILSPVQLVSRAVERGVTCLALTDHDTLSGIAEAESEARRLGLQLIPGIEFSCLWQGVGVHVVGLNVDPEREALLAAVAGQTESRTTRAQMIGERLAKLGFVDAYAGATALAGGEVGRPHFARYLVEIGAVKDINAAFKQYLGAGKAGDVKQLWPEVGQAVSWILAGGGVPVLAHPDKYKMTRSKLLRLVKEFVEAGGQALEVVSGRQDPHLTATLAKLAQDAGLYASIGSDFHVPDQPWQELGAMGALPVSCRPVWQLWQ